MNALVIYILSLVLNANRLESTHLLTVDSTTSARFAVENVSCMVPNDAVKLNQYLVASTKRLDRRMQHAMSGIDGVPKRLLALKYYLKRGRAIRSSWAWTKQQTLQYKKSSAYAKSIDAVNDVIKTFERDNPGYGLKVNTDVRGLGDQVGLWNTTRSVHTAAGVLYDDMTGILGDSAWPAAPNTNALRKFESVLLKTPVAIVPTVAVPGFSRHGQLRAFDFVIMKGQSVVAGIEAESASQIWDAAGWTRRLRDAIAGTTDSFHGPLSTPYEPWHYEYIP
jgi:hypothetical protein